MITEENIVELIIAEEWLVCKTSLFRANGNRQRNSRKCIDNAEDNIKCTDDFSIERSKNIVSSPNLNKCTKKE